MPEEPAYEILRRWGAQHADLVTQTSAAAADLSAATSDVRVPADLDVRKARHLASELAELAMQLRNVPVAGDPEFDRALHRAADAWFDSAFAWRDVTGPDDGSTSAVRVATAKIDEAAESLKAALDRMRAVGFPLPDIY